MIKDSLGEVHRQLPTMGTFWIGTLSYLEQMCLLSFVACGHKVVLFSYEPVANLPPEIENVDAREIMEKPAFHYDKKNKSPAPTSDLFRLKMLAKTDFIWVDADMFCVKPFIFQDDVIVGRCWGVANNAVLRLPKSSDCLRELIEFLEGDDIPEWWTAERRELYLHKKNRGKVKSVIDFEFGVYGPAALSHFMGKFGLSDRILKRQVFYPIQVRFVKQLKDMSYDYCKDRFFTQQTVGIHFWGHQFRRRYHTDAPNSASIIAELAKSVGVDPEKAPIPEPTIPK